MKHLTAVALLICAVVPMSAQEIKLVPFENLEATPPMEPDIDLGSDTYGPGFQLGDRGAFITLTPQGEVTDWTGRAMVRMRIYAGGPPDARIVLTIFPEGEWEGSYWWTRITANWEGWKEIELPLGAANVNEGFVASNKGSQPLPPTFENIVRMEIRNQWGSAGPDSDNWAISPPSPGIWGIEWITVE